MHSSHGPKVIALENQGKCARGGGGGGGGCGGWCTITPLSRNGNGNGIVSFRWHCRELCCLHGNCRADERTSEPPNLWNCWILQGPELRVGVCLHQSRSLTQSLGRAPLSQQRQQEEPNPRRHKTKLRTLIIVGVESRVQRTDPAAAEAAAVVHGVP